MMSRFARSDDDYRLSTWGPGIACHRLTIVGYPPPHLQKEMHHVRLVKSIREITGYGLKQAKELADEVRDRAVRNGHKVVLGIIAQDDLSHKSIMELTNYCYIAWEPAESGSACLDLNWRDRIRPPARWTEEELQMMSVDELATVAKTLRIPPFDPNWPRVRIITEIMSVIRRNTGELP